MYHELVDTDKREDLDIEEMKDVLKALIVRERQKKLTEAKADQVDKVEKQETSKIKLHVG